MARLPENDASVYLRKETESSGLVQCRFERSYDWLLPDD